MWGSHPHCGYSFQHSHFRTLHSRSPFCFSAYGTLSYHTVHSTETPISKSQFPNKSQSSNSKLTNFVESAKTLPRVYSFLLERRSGASDGSRTRNLFLDQEALYQLSYRGAVLLSTKSASLWSLMIGHCLVFGAWFLGFPCCARYP